LNNDFRNFYIRSELDVNKNVNSRVKLIFVGALKDPNRLPIDLANDFQMQIIR